jgi:putative inorganic carbon (HCO3(-)) transporter
MKGLILTYLITFVGSIAALRYPLIGLHVYVGFAILRPQSIFSFAGDLSYISLIVGTAMLIGWAVNGFGSWKFGRGRPVVVSLMLFAGWFVISATQAINTEGAFLAVQTFAKTVLPVLVGVTLLKEEKDCRQMMWTIVLAQAYVCFELNLDYLFKGTNTANVGFGGMDNNFLGLSLVTTIGPAVALAIGGHNWRQRLIAATAAALILHATLLTFSRGAMVGLLAVGVTAVVMMPKRPKYMAAVLLTVLLAVRLTGPELLARYRTTFVSEEVRDGSAESRIDLWRDCIKVIQEYPVFGVGPWNWSVVASKYGWSEGKSAHSVWMETAAETGLPGVLFLMLFFAIAGKRLWRVARARPTETNLDQINLANGIVLSLAGFVVSGQFVSAANLELAYYVTMVGVGLLTVTTRETADATVAGVVAPPLTFPPFHGAGFPATLPRVNRQDRRSD